MYIYIFIYIYMYIYICSRTQQRHDGETGAWQQQTAPGTKLRDKWLRAHRRHKPTTLHCKHQATLRLQQ